MGKRNVNIYQYSNHQEYLRDWVAQNKEAGAPISLRWLADRLGLRSRGYLQKVLHDAEGPLSEDVREKLIPVLRLSASEAEYFRALVQFNHARSLEEKNLHYTRMHRLLLLRETGMLEAAQYEYLSHWWLPVLREVAVMRDWGEDQQGLGAVINPPVSAAKVRKGLALLVRLGLLRQEGTRFVQVDLNVSTGHDLQSLAIVNYHQANLDAAREAVGKLAMDERELGAITFGIPATAYCKLRERMRTFLQELVEESYQAQGSPDQVYQFAMQLFPVTKKISQK